MSDAHGASSQRCRELFERLSDYLDGELETELCEEFDAHIYDCTPCTSFLRSLRRTIELTRDLPCPSLPPELESRLRQAQRRLRDRR